MIIPAVGSRFEFRSGRERRTWELHESKPLESANSRGRHVLRCVSESGFIPAFSFGVGSFIYVDDAWFANRLRADGKSIKP